MLHSVKIELLLPSVITSKSNYVAEYFMMLTSLCHCEIFIDIWKMI